MRTTIQFRERSYDDWLAAGPHEDLPNAETVTKRETCEHCGATVAAVSVARCKGHSSYWPSRPERDLKFLRAKRDRERAERDARIAAYDVRRAVEGDERRKSEESVAG